MRLLVCLFLVGCNVGCNTPHRSAKFIQEQGHEYLVITKGNEKFKLMIDDLEYPPPPPSMATNQ